MYLEIAQTWHLDELMTWFVEAESCRLWGGRYLRFPFNRPALGCYARMGFVITDAPEDTYCVRECWYMTMMIK